MSNHPRPTTELEISPERAAELAEAGNAHGLSIAEVLYARKLGMPLDEYAALRGAGTGAMSVDQYQAGQAELAAQREARAKATEELLVERAKAKLQKDGVW